jgi:hypothetical protein
MLDRSFSASATRYPALQRRGHEWTREKEREREREREREGEEG